MFKLGFTALRNKKFFSAEPYVNNERKQQQKEQQQQQTYRLELYFLLLRLRLRLEAAALRSTSLKINTLFSLFIYIST